MTKRSAQDAGRAFTPHARELSLEQSREPPLPLRFPRFKNGNPTIDKSRSVSIQPSPRLSVPPIRRRRNDGGKGIEFCSEAIPVTIGDVIAFEFPPGPIVRTLVALTVFDLSLHQLLIRAGACIVVVAIHGFALAAIARVMGDRGPQFDERLTLNPIGHLDILGAATMSLFQLGWIRPIVVDSAQLRFGRVGLILCVLASLAATLGAVVLLLGLRIPALSLMPGAVVPTVIATLNATVEMCTWFVAFNLLPLPPLTGAHVLVAARPGLAPLLAYGRIYAGIALAVLILTGMVQPFVRPVRDAVAYFLPGS